MALRNKRYREKTLNDKLLCLMTGLATVLTAYILGGTGAPKFLAIANFPQVTSTRHLCNAYSLTRAGVKAAVRGGTFYLSEGTPRPTAECGGEGRAAVGTQRWELARGRLPQMLQGPPLKPGY